MKDKTILAIHLILAAFTTQKMIMNKLKEAKGIIKIEIHKNRWHHKNLHPRKKINLGNQIYKASALNLNLSKKWES